MQQWEWHVTGGQNIGLAVLTHCTTVGLIKTLPHRFRESEVAVLCLSSIANRAKGTISLLHNSGNFTSSFLRVQLCLALHGHSERHGSDPALIQPKTMFGRTAVDSLLDPKHKSCLCTAQAYQQRWVTVPTSLSFPSCYLKAAARRRGYIASSWGSITRAEQHRWLAGVLKMWPRLVRQSESGWKDVSVGKIKTWT